MIHGSHTQAYATAPALVSLALAKVHLKKDSDTSEDTLIQSYINSATQWCEMYIQRSLCVSQITMYYQNPGTVTIPSDFVLMYPIDPTKAITITATDTCGDINIIMDYTVVRGVYDMIRIRSICDYEMLTIAYTTRKYEHADRIIPAILMKTGQMYTLRDDGETPKSSAIINILNLHRIKKHL